MSNMDRYAGVQNPQLYQQILEEERKKRAREASGSSLLHDAARTLSSGAAQPSPAQEWTPQQRQAADELMGKTSSTNLYSNLQSKLRGRDYGTSVQAPKPGITIDTSNGKLDLSTMLGGVGYVMADYAKTGVPKAVTLKAPDPKTIKGYRQTWVDEGAGKGYFAKTPIYETEEEDWEDIRQNAPSEAELEWYKKAYEDSGMLFEPGMELGEKGVFREEALALDPFQKIVIQERQQHQEEGEAFYDDNKASIEQTTSAIDDIYESYSDSGLGNEVLDYETAVSIYYGRADDSVLDGLSQEQQYAFAAWAELAQVHDMVDSYIRAYGERGIFTREYLDQLNQKMNGIVKYDRDFWEQMGYQASEILAGIISVGEAALRFTAAVGYGLFSAGASLVGSEYWADDWKKRGEGWLSESWSRDFREQMQAELNADSKDMKMGQYSFMLGQLLPGVVIAASTGGAGVGSMLGATSSGYGSYAVFGALATAGYSAQAAIAEGARFDQALTYGALAGLLDLGAAAAFGGVGRKMGVDTRDISQRIAGRVCKSELGEYFARQFISAALEQPMDTLAMSIQPALKRMTYDPDAKPYSAKQIADATLLGFFEKGLRNVAFSLPELGEILGRTQDLGDTSVKVPEHIKKKIDADFEETIAKAQAGETPDTGAAEATPEAAVAQMVANTQADTGKPAGFEPTDPLARVLAAGIEAEALARDAALPTGGQASQRGAAQPGSLETEFSFAPGKQAAPPAQAQGGEGGFREAKGTDAVDNVGSNSPEAAAFTKALDLETNDAAKPQTGNYQRQETAPGAENNNTQNSFGGEPRTDNDVPLNNKLPTNVAQLKHIFSDRPGHLPDTPENQKLIESVTNDRANYIGYDARGCYWFSCLTEDGSQIWVRCRNGKIDNAGINSPDQIRPWNPKTGFYNNPEKRNR